LLLQDKVALITGSAKGMGKAMALRFAREGCSVVVADLLPEEGQKVAEEIRSGGQEAIAIKVDITSSKEIRLMADEAVKKFGKIDILVNNAGAAGGGSLEESDEEEWDKVLALNLKGAFLVCKAVAPYMKRQRYGKIINISSMGAVRPSISVLAYHSAKAGIIGLTRNLAFELAPFNICVNGIVPGPIDTPFWDPLCKGMSDEQRKAFFAALAKKEVPLGRMGTPEDIAGPALFFASELSSYVTGQILCVAGGQPGLTIEATFISAPESRSFSTPAP